LASLLGRLAAMEQQSAAQQQQLSAQQQQSAAQQQQLSAQQQKSAAQQQQLSAQQQKSAAQQQQLSVRAHDLEACARQARGRLPASHNTKAAEETRLGILVHSQIHKDQKGSSKQLRYALCSVGRIQGPPSLTCCLPTQASRRMPLPFPGCGSAGSGDEARRGERGAHRGVRVCRARCQSMSNCKCALLYGLPQSAAFICGGLDLCLRPWMVH
jgi:hypothetical protein